MLPDSSLRSWLVKGLMMLAPFVVGEVAARAQEASVLSYADAIRRAQAQSPTRKRAALAQEQAAAARALVEYDDDPRLVADASYTHQYRDAAAVRGEKPKAVSQEQSYGLSLSMALFDFGRMAAARRQAAAMMQSRTLQISELDEALRISVARAYLAAIGAERLARIAREQKAVAVAKANEQTRDYRRGLRPESDVLTADLDRARAEAQLARAEHEARA